MLVAAFLFLATQGSSSAAAPRPHFVFVLADDLGWYDTAVHNPNSPTPTLAELAKDGLTLDRHYVFRYCSPTRRSFLSGRFPNRITSVQPDGGNLCSDFLPLATTTIAEKLAGVGYECHFVGKGHLGYQTMDHLPINRGFVSHVGYLSGSESYTYGDGSSNATHGKHDMWHDLHPGIDVVPEMYYSTNYYADVAVRIIKNHSSSTSATTMTTSPAPLFMYLPSQNVHSPYERPPEWECDKFPDMWDDTYANMLHMLDVGTMNVTNALKQAGFWENTLFLFSADNGGIGKFGNNYPLRGHKHDPWEGGTRVTAFLAGGFLPQQLRGTSSGDKLVHVADWYATISVLAGADPTNSVEIDGEVRPVDSVNVWPMLTEANLTHPRPITPTSEAGIINVVTDGVTGETKWFKLVTLAGQSVYYSQDANQTDGSDTCLAARQPDPPQPGRTDPIVNGCPVCNATSPCVYEIIADPGEKKNVAAGHPDMVAKLAPILEMYNDYYVSGRIPAAQLAKDYKPIDISRWQGYLGPCYERV